jgi:site-specific recombinase XerD
VITLAQAMNEFMSARNADQLASSTLAWYRVRLAPFVARLAGSSLHIDRVPVRDVRNYIADLRSRTVRYENAPQRRQIDGGLSDETIRGHVRALRRFFKWCVREYDLPAAVNPMVKIETPRRGHPAPKANHTDDLHKLLNACSADAIGARDKAMLAFLADTGCRAGGLLTLRLSDLRIEDGQAIVHEKGRRDRVVPFSPYTTVLLKNWIEVRPAKASTVFCALTPQLMGKPLTLSGLHSMIRRLKKRSGVTGGANPHGWRHHLGWYWLNEGGDLATLSLIMGHSDPATTLRYYAIFMMGEAIKKHRQFSPMRGME